MDKKYIGEVSPEELDKLKVKYGKIKIVDVEDEDEVYRIYLKRPDFETIKAVNKIAKSDDLEASKIFLRNCMVEGAKEVLEDGVLFVAASSAASELLTSTKATLKNA